MAYWKETPKNTRTVDSFGLSTNQGGGATAPREFYEIERGVVLDIVLDDKHPIITGGESIHSKIDPDRWPADLQDQPPLKTDIDYTWIGRALIRPLISEKLTDKDQLIWAYPLDNNLSEYPLIHETVYLITQGERLYYSRRLNYHNWPNNNLNFSIEGATSGKTNNVLFTDTPLTGKIESKTNYKADSGFHGYAGQYFVANNKIRTIKRWEGDLLLESRHGQTIHLTAYDKTRENDEGDPKYKEYKDGGNPMIIIRNRQRPLLKEGQTLSLQHSPNPATVVGTKYEKNVGGYLEENINHDGSSVYITCGKTESEWKTTCFKRMFGDNKGEEVTKFKGQSKFKYPKLNGDQIVINTDRLILSSRYEEMFQYSKKRISIVTDSEYTVDSHDQIVLTTHNKAVINAPAIYLGEYNETNEPMLLGQTTVNWLYELCNWLLEHTHWYKHSHEDAGKESPSKTQIPVQVQQLIALRDKLNLLMSRRCYVVGGGLAPGQDGAPIAEGETPVVIDVASGAGAPGVFKGKNYRIGLVEAQEKYGVPMAAVFGPNGIVEDSSKNEEQKIQELKELPVEQQQIVAKGGGCGGRRAQQVGIFKKQSSTTQTNSTNGINNISSSISSSISAISPNIASNIASGLPSGFSSVASNIASGLPNGTTNIQSNISNVSSNISSGISGITSNMTSTIASNIAARLPSGFSSVASNIATKLPSGVSNITSNVTSNASTIASGLSIKPQTTLDTVQAAEIAKWNSRIAFLKKAGIEELDALPPKEVDVEDWKIVVANFV